MADQSASLFGSGCFQPGDMKITMGTGTFLNVNTGTEPHVSITGKCKKKKNDKKIKKGEYKFNYSFMHSRIK